VSSTTGNSNRRTPSPRRPQAGPSTAADADEAAVPDLEDAVDSQRTALTPGERSEEDATEAPAAATSQTAEHWGRTALTTQMKPPRAAPTLPAERRPAWLVTILDFHGQQLYNHTTQEKIALSGALTRHFCMAAIGAAVAIAIVLIACAGLFRSIQPDLPSWLAPTAAALTPIGGSALLLVRLLRKRG
jgi:hypothetical protein